MKRLLLLLLLLAPAPALADTLVYSGWILNGDDLTINRDVFTILFSTTTKIYAQQLDTFLSVQNGSCGTTDHAMICLDTTTYDTTAKRYKALVRAYALMPSISVTRSIDKTTIPLKDTALVTTTISNTGSNVADNGYFLDDFGDDFVVTEIDMGTAEGGKAYWEGALGKDQSRTITYRIQPQQATERSFKASYSYFDGFENKTTYSGDIKIIANPFLKLVSTTPRTDVPLGWRSNITVNLSNDYDHATNITAFSVSFSDGLLITEYPTSMRRDRNTFRWDGIIDENRTIHKKSFFFRFLTVRSGGNAIIATGSYKDDEGMPRSLFLKQDISTTFSDRTVLSSSLLSGEQFESLEVKQLKVWVQNENHAINYSNVSVSFTSSLLNLSNLSLRLDAGDQAKVIDLAVTMPKANATVSDTLAITAAFTTSFGESGKEELRLPFTLQPVKDLEITQDISKPVLEGDEETVIRVYATNHRTVDISNVRITDSVPDFVMTGSNQALLTVNHGDKKEAYQYVLKAPRLSQERVYNLTTTANYSDNRSGYAYTRRSQITVKPKRLALTLSSQFTDSSLYRGQLAQVKYTITNSDTEPAFDVKLFFPVQAETAIVGDTSYAIERLDPGESFYLTTAGRMIFKMNGSILVMKPAISFSDQFGNRFAVNGSELHAQAGPGQGTVPLIWVWREWDGKNLFYHIANNGTQESRVSFEDLGQKWNISVPANTTVTSEQHIRFAKSSNLSLFNVTFSCLDTACHTVAPSLRLEVAPNVGANGTQGGDTGSINDSDAPPDEEPGPKPVPVSIWEGIKRFLRSIFPR
ncbi:MAG: hypothetical protein V1735_03880 [Nanoarchaeota archaeon]